MIKEQIIAVTVLFFLPPLESYSRWTAIHFQDFPGECAKCTFEELVRVSEITLTCLVQLCITDKRVVGANLCYVHM